MTEHKSVGKTKSTSYSAGLLGKIKAHRGLGTGYTKIVMIPAGEYM